MSEQQSAAASAVEAFQSLYDQGSFGALLPQLQSWLAAPVEAPTEPLLRALVLELRCLAKLESWEELARKGARLLRRPELADRPAAIDTLILLSYGELQFGDAEMSLRAAHAALQLALRLRSIEHVAQALDRLAMSYLWLGDSLLAERYLLEAIGYCHQIGDPDTSLLRYSNGLVLLVTIYDALQAAGRDDEARALAQRMQRFVNQGLGVEHRARRQYERRLWAANLARWQARRDADHGRSREQLRAALDEARERGWGNMQRTLSLDLARFALADGQPELALRYLQQMNAPELGALRLLHARSQQQLLARAYRELGLADAQAAAELRLAALQQREAAAIAQVREQLPELHHAIGETLSQSDRQFIDTEMHRLREAQAQGKALETRGG